MPILLDLDEFEHGLLETIEWSGDVRPFVCEGSPLDCAAFIVGFNPATEMKAGFWDFWLAGYGFDKAAWFEEYKRERAERPPKPGKKSRPAVSPSRRVIDQIVSAAAPVKILETNIFARPTSAKIDLALEHRDAAPFRFLIDVIKPSVVVAHGKDAHDALVGLGQGIQVLRVPHFSRGWSYEEARRLGSSLVQHQR